MTDEVSKPAVAVRLQRPVGRLAPERGDVAGPMTEGELWSWVRSVMSQGADIRCDYDSGRHKSYEAYSARLDAAAAERAEELLARMKTPNVANKLTA